MAFHKLIHFDRPLSGAVLANQPGKLFTESEVSALADAAYRRGADTARAAADQQLVELRHTVQELSNGVLQKLSTMEPSLVTQVQEALPGLVVDVTRRLLAGFEPSVEVINRLCCEAIEQLAPEIEGLELTLCPRDAALLNELSPEWTQRYPGLRICTNASLVPGDCLVRSRFGLTDARLQTKVQMLEHSLSGG